MRRLGRFPLQARSGGGGGGGRPPGDPAPTAAAATDALIGALVTVGLSGTLAIGSAKLLGVDLFRRFAWDGVALGQAAAAAAPLLLLDAFLALPDFGTPTTLLAGRVELDAAWKDGGSGGGSGGVGGGDGSGDGSGGIDLYALQEAGWRLDVLTLALNLYQTEALGLRRPSPFPPPAQAALVLLRELSKELLQRGLVATVAAGW